MPITFSRHQFDQACKAYVATHSNDGLSGLKGFPSGWTWIEHSHFPKLGYLSRTVRFLRRSTGGAVENDNAEEILEEDDDAVCIAPGGILTCMQYIVHSATFEVPTFYFTMHDTSGSPLSLAQILESPIFRLHALPNADGNTFALTPPESSFALLSQGDHPTLGTPSWYFHPCNSAQVVGEIVTELDDRQDNPLRWIEAWFMVVGNIVDFFAGVG